ncbi:hypothetical protein T439DRAFT_381098 [Meredithblackwellia eburnea MCA 4105]
MGTSPVKSRTAILGPVVCALVALAFFTVYSPSWLTKSSWRYNEAAEIVKVEEGEVVVDVGAPRVSPSQEWSQPLTNVLKLHEDNWPTPLIHQEHHRYLSYLPHSGYHNQRISLENALVLSKLLNRTLLVPDVTLGSAVNWYHFDRLQRELEKAERSTIRKCQAIKDRVERGRACGAFWSSIRASWSFLLDAPRIAAEFDVVHRVKISRDWYREGLGIEGSQIKTFPDKDRYSYKIYDDPNDTTPLEQRNLNYTSRLDISDLLTFDNYKLLEFGSLFGSQRLVLSHPANAALHHDIERMMPFKEPTLDAVSDAIVRKLGSEFVGLHLRVGHKDRFEDNARGRSAGVFQALCAAFGLDKDSTAELLRSNRQHPDDPSYKPPSLQPFTPQTAYYPSPTLVCPYTLYPSSSPLKILNKPLYVATDAVNPRNNPIVELFLNTFPCMFFLSDFQTTNNISREEIPSLNFLQGAVDEKGDTVGPFLLPFVEAEVVAKAQVAVGTPGSTFSGFATGTLHEVYMNSHSGHNVP